MPLISLPVDKLIHLGSIFSEHKWIEPSETIDDVKVFHLQNQSILAVQFEVLVFGLQKWSASAAFPLTHVPTSDSSMSEDEQDEYEEAEAAKELLMSKLAEAEQALSSGRVTDQKEKLEKTIQEAEAILSDFERGIPKPEIFCDKAKHVKDELDKYSR